MSRIVAVKFVSLSASQATSESEIGNSSPVRRSPTSSTVVPITRVSPVSRKRRSPASWRWRKRSGISRVRSRPLTCSEEWPNMRSAAGLR